MLPKKRKSLIIWIISIIGIIIVIILMYNFSKFMHSRGPKEPVIVDDAYNSEYSYYGFAIDEDGNYQLMGLNSEMDEELLGLRSFYPMSNMYYYNNHLLVYTDAINQINYNKEENKYFFNEINSFYNNNADVLITETKYIFYANGTLEYCEINECNKVLIDNELTDDLILLGNNEVFYQKSDGIYMYDFTTNESKIIMLPSPNGGLRLLGTDREYVIIINGGEVYSYNIDNDTSNNISNIILSEEQEFSVVNIQNGYFIYQVIDENGNYNLKKFSLLINNTLKNNFGIGKEMITIAFVVDDKYLYAELVDNNDNLRYVIIDMENEQFVRDLNYSYVTLIGVE